MPASTDHQGWRDDVLRAFGASIGTGNDGMNGYGGGSALSKVRAQRKWWLAPVPLSGQPPSCVWPAATPSGSYLPHIFTLPPASCLPSWSTWHARNPLRSALDPGSLRPSSWGLAAAPLAFVQFLIPDGPSLFLSWLLHRFCKPLSSEFFDVGGTAVLERLSRLRRVAKKTQRHSQPSAHGGSPWTWIQYSPIEPGQQGGNTAQQPKNTKVSCADFGQVARNLLAFHTLDEPLFLCFLFRRESSFFRFSHQLSWRRHRQPISTTSKIAATVD